MKKLIAQIALLFAVAVAASAAAPAPLATLRAVRALTKPQAAHQLPVAFEATVTFFRASEGTLFVQDKDAAIYVSPPGNGSFVPGDRVLIKGNTHADFSPIVAGKSITLVRHGVAPRPVPATYDDLIRARRDCMLVKVQAEIRAVDVHMRYDTRDASQPMHPVARVQMLADGGYFEALVDGPDAGSLSDLLDAEVEVTGIASFGFDGKMQPTGIELEVTSRAGFEILNRAEADPWSIPATPMDRIFTSYHVRDLTQRVRVHGAVTYYQPGSAVVIQDGTRSLWISTMNQGPLRVGDIADAIGFPDVHNGPMTLTRAEIKDSKTWAQVSPEPVTVKQLMHSGNLFDLVSIEGQVVTSVREASQDEYVLVAGGQKFTAILRHPDSSPPPMKQIPAGSRIRVNGICILEDSNPFNAPQIPFDILLRSSDDVTVVAGPSWISVRNLLLLVGLLVAIVVAVGARAWYIERGMRRQTSALAARIEIEAALERRRSRILEDINGSRPLAEILEEIAEAVSSSLNGAPCWCEVADGSRLGDHPRQPDCLRIRCLEIPARAGAPSGALFAGFEPETEPGEEETEALFVGARLAALAIETRYLHSDLIHRSEFDLLTDIHNRFSLDRHLDGLIEEAGRQAGIFGLIYIDLDDFKQVNDLCGHQVGDFYLQEAALRMKRQLRSHDLLARLGGDEFAVLVPMIHNRADAEEIALRVERCFDAPLAIEGFVLHGSASVGIALYPQDGATKDGLLNAADAAMYETKNAKKQIGQILVAEQQSLDSPMSTAKE